MLLAADGVSNTEVAARVGGVAPDGDLLARPVRLVGCCRPGRRGPIWSAADRRPVQDLGRDAGSAAEEAGVTHWSSRLLAAHLKVDASTVLRTWRHYRVQPWRRETFKFSTDPELVAKVTGVVGLFLAPPENAIVLCVDELGQALDRTEDAADATESARASHP